MKEKEVKEHGKLSPTTLCVPFSKHQEGSAWSWDVNHDDIYVIFSESFLGPWYFGDKMVKICTKKWFLPQMSLNQTPITNIVTKGNFEIPNTKHFLVHWGNH